MSIDRVSILLDKKVCDLLHNSVNIFNTTELYSQDGEDGKFNVRFSITIKKVSAQ